MSIPDGLIVQYLRLTTTLPDSAIEEIERGIADGSVRPDLAKRRLAREVVDLYHGAEAGTEAEKRFDLVHKAHELPDEVAEIPIPRSLASQDRVWVPRLLKELGLAGSTSEGRRLIEQGGVRIDGTRVGDPGQEVAVVDLMGKVLQVGTRKFVRITG
jgi:tyrosyl-tRNA synthetase